LGSTTALTDGNGKLVERETYDAYGNSSGSANTRYGYTGRERDSLTGLMYYRARFYDPQLGRFISEDPIGFLGRDVNLYGYVKNRPLLFRDPTGWQRCDPIVGALVGGGAGGVVGIIGGTLLGGPVGGVIGAIVGGGGGSFVGPEGTIIGGGGGAVAGAAIGTAAGPYVGGITGAGVGAYIGYRICSGGEKTCDKTDTRPWSPNPPTDPDRERKCMIQWESDNSLCRILPNSAARARCYASANARLAACLRNLPEPPLIDH
jgi:RHS repeat-associated protein